MTNKELVLKQLGEDTDTLAEILAGDCELCKSFGTEPYCKSDETRYLTCKATIEAWLNMEHTEPLLFPIGTVIEVTYGDGSKTVAYYNGSYSGKHYVTYVSKNVGKVVENGKPYGSDFDANALKKVGD